MLTVIITGLARPIPADSDRLQAVLEGKSGALAQIERLPHHVAADLSSHPQAPWLARNTGRQI